MATAAARSSGGRQAKHEAAVVERQPSEARLIERGADCAGRLPRLRACEDHAYVQRLQRFQPRCTPPAIFQLYLGLQPRWCSGALGSRGMSPQASSVDRPRCCRASAAPHTRAPSACGWRQRVSRWPKTRACGLPYQTCRQRRGQCSPVWVRRRRVGQGASLDHARPHLRYVAWSREHGRGGAGSGRGARGGGRHRQRGRAIGRYWRGRMGQQHLVRHATARDYRQRPSPPAAPPPAPPAGARRWPGHCRRRAGNQQARTVTPAVRPGAAARAGRWRRRSSRCPQCPLAQLV